MIQRFKHRATTAAALAALLGGFSSASFACSSDPYMASICIMAWARPTASFGNNTYLPANGATLPISSYQALYSLIGVTYGGNGTTTFQLPDLRGRMVIGAGQYVPTGAVYNVGQTGGAPSTTLTAAQLPTHVHTLTQGRVTTNTTLGNMAAATTLNGVSASASASGLTLNGSSGGNFATSPSGATLGSYAGTTKIYSDAAPTVAMKAGSITGSAAVTFTGNPSTTLSGAPVVTVSGSTDPTGSSAPVGTMSPYLVMSYYIAANGLYPTPD